MVPRPLQKLGGNSKPLVSIPIIDLKGELGIQLGINVLEHRCSSEHVPYFDLEMDYRPLSQAMLDDYARMARAFLLFLLEAYLFANGMQKVSLRWLTLFHKFEHV